jgi:hypothetical protein
MSKLLLFMAALLIFTGLPIFAAQNEELELGMAFVPIGAITKDKDEQRMDDYANQIDQTNDYDPNTEGPEKTFMEEWMIGFHVAYNWGIIYASIDAIALPPFLVKEMTSFEDEFGYFEGFDRPGFLNFIDIGAKFTIGEMVFFASTGINDLYIYREGELPQDMKNKVPQTLGTNLRIGANYKITSNLSVGLTGTSVFPSFETMSDVLKGVFGDPAYAHMKDQMKLLPMLAVTYYM